MAEKQLSVLIIGAGNKGKFGPHNHADAFVKSGFNLVGFVDPEKFRESGLLRGVPVYETIDAAFNMIGHVDVVSVAVPDDQHELVLNDLIGRNFLLVFAEKPFTRSRQSAHSIAFHLAFKGCEAGERGRSIAVNYTRRYSPIFQELRGLIADGELGDFLGGSGFYGNGLLHNGSHLIDLFFMLLDEVKVHSPGVAITDVKFDDPSVYGFLEVRGCPVYLGVIPRPAVNAFEATLYFTGAVVRVLDIGRKIEITRTAARPDYPVERVYFGNDSNSWDVRSPMMVAVENIKAHLNNGTPLLCTSDDAIRVLKICEAFAPAKAAV